MPQVSDTSTVVHQKKPALPNLYTLLSVPIQLYRITIQALPSGKQTEETLQYKNWNVIHN